ncbi:MAG: hypothetical protein R2685_14275 [Candidatus Nitrosocosmicus sp.]|nr:hypothetical protein [Candidatus Nitrosocosmicus sp.]
MVIRGFNKHVNNLKETEVESRSQIEAKALVDELESIYDKRIRGNMRIVLEAIGKENRKKFYPTLLEISTPGIRFENRKKLLYRAKERDLVVTHPVRKGHAFRYALSNMQDFPNDDIVSSVATKKSNEKIDLNEILTRSLFYIDAMKEMLDHSIIKFHHIVVAAEFDYKDDYDWLDWRIPSTKNKAKVLSRTISRNRGFLLTAYPNGKIMMNIRCSNHPFDLFSHDGLMDFYITSGQIVEQIYDKLGYEDLFSADPREWKVTQIDGAYDIRVKDLERAVVEKTPVNRGGWISFKFPSGGLKVKYLNELYQIYQKRLPYEGNCIRLERRFGFKKPYPSLGDIKYNYSR